MMLRRSCCFVVIIMVIIGTKIFAQDYSGARIVPIMKTVPQTSFNLKTDAVSIFLEKAVLYKHNGWFTKDKQLVVTAKMHINSRKSGSHASELTMSRIYKFDLSYYGGGRMEIPLWHLPLLDVYNLSGSEYVITTIVMDLSISKSKVKTGFSQTFESIIDASKKIPVPPNPYIESATVVIGAFNNVVESAIKEEGETAPFASFGLSFLQGSKGFNYSEKTGEYAILMGSSIKDKGIIDINNIIGDSLTYDDGTGLRYNNNAVWNNYLIVKVVASIDPMRAELYPEETLARIKTLGNSYLEYSKKYGINTDGITALMNPQIVYKSFPGQKDNWAQIDKAVKEINTIGGNKSFKYDSAKQPQ